jgi:hypothetical protein
MGCHLQKRKNPLLEEEKRAKPRKNYPDPSKTKLTTSNDGINERI